MIDWFHNPRSLNSERPRTALSIYLRRTRNQLFRNKLLRGPTHHWGRPSISTSDGVWSPNEVFRYKCQRSGLNAVFWTRLKRYILKVSRDECTRLHLSLILISHKWTKTSLPGSLWSVGTTRLSTRPMMVVLRVVSGLCLYQAEMEASLTS